MCALYWNCIGDCNMAFSDIAKGVLKQLAEPATRSNVPRINQVTYAVETGLINADRDGTTSKLTFKFNKPVSEALLNSRAGAALTYLARNLDVYGETEAIDAILAQVMGTKKTVGKKRTTGKAMVRLGEAEDPTGNPSAITGASGRFVSNTNLKSILELVAKDYLIKDMKKAGAPLKFRTGRFANSLKIKDLVQNTNEKEVPQLNITYNYMTRPYSVFNPAVSTYRRLSLNPYPGARNPQRLIGNAIAKAARDLIHSRYRIKINQGT